MKHEEAVACLAEGEWEQLGAGEWRKGEFLVQKGLNGNWCLWAFGRVLVANGGSLPDLLKAKMRGSATVSVAQYLSLRCENNCSYT